MWPVNHLCTAMYKELKSRYNGLTGHIDQDLRCWSCFLEMCKAFNQRCFTRTQLCGRQARNARNIWTTKAADPGQRDSFGKPSDAYSYAWLRTTQFHRCSVAWTQMCPHMPHWPLQHSTHDLRIFHSLAFALTSVTSTKAVPYDMDCLDSRPTRKDMQVPIPWYVMQPLGMTRLTQYAAVLITAPYSSHITWYGMAVHSHGILVVAFVVAHCDTYSSSRITSQRSTMDYISYFMQIHTVTRVWHTCGMWNAGIVMIWAAFAHQAISKALTGQEAFVEQGLVWATSALWKQQQ